MSKWLFLTAFLIGWAPALAQAQSFSIADSATFWAIMQGKYTAARKSNQTVKPDPQSTPATRRAQQELQVMVWGYVATEQDIVQGLGKENVDYRAAQQEFDRLFGGLYPSVGPGAPPQDTFTRATDGVRDLGASIDKFRHYAPAFRPIRGSVRDIAETLSNWSQQDPFRTHLSDVDPQTGQQNLSYIDIDNLDDYRLQVDQVIHAVEARINTINAATPLPSAASQPPTPYSVADGMQWAVYRDVVEQFKKFQADAATEAAQGNLAKKAELLQWTTAKAGRSEIVFDYDAFVATRLDRSATIIRAAPNRTLREDRLDFQDEYSKMPPSQQSIIFAAEMDSIADHAVEFPR
jgi:hypothetical protein